ncbi:hypothetical protein EMIT0P291_260057 [Pseudomonas sp. IT-P291]
MDEGRHNPVPHRFCRSNFAATKAAGYGCTQGLNLFETSESVLTHFEGWHHADGFREVGVVDRGFEHHFVQLFNALTGGVGVQSNHHTHFVVTRVDALVEAQKAAQVEGAVRFDFQAVNLDTHHRGVGGITDRHAGVESGHQQLLRVRRSVLAQQFIRLIGDDFEIPRIGFTGQTVAIDFGHRASLAFPLSLDVEARVAHGPILSNALGKLLECGDIDTIQVIAHVFVPLRMDRAFGPKEKQAYQLVGCPSTDYSSYNQSQKKQLRKSFLSRDNCGHTPQV